jgi:hypothetical protein
MALPQCEGFCMVCRPKWCIRNNNLVKYHKSYWYQKICQALLFFNHILMICSYRYWFGIHFKTTSFFKVQIGHVQLQENNKNTTTERKSIEHLKVNSICFDCSLQYTLWKQTIEKIAVEDAFIAGFQKRLVELQKHRRDDLVLYNVIRSQRNKLIHLTEVSILVIIFASWSLCWMREIIENWIES